MSYFNEPFSKPVGAVDIPFKDYVIAELKNYLENPSEDALTKITPVPVAHTMHIIFKNCERLYKDVFLKLTDECLRAAFCMETPYNLFDKEKVFFGPDVRWSFPFTVSKGETLRSNFKSHNFFYFKGYERLDENNKLSRFYQDLDILTSDELWKEELIKALYRVVMGAYSAYMMLLMEKSNINKSKDNQEDFKELFKKEFSKMK